MQKYGLMCDLYTRWVAAGGRGGGAATATHFKLNQVNQTETAAAASVITRAQLWFYNTIPGTFFYQKHSQYTHEVIDR